METKPMNSPQPPATIDPQVALAATLAEARLTQVQAGASLAHTAPASSQPSLRDLSPWAR